MTLKEWWDEHPEVDGFYGDAERVYNLAVDSAWNAVVQMVPLCACSDCKAAFYELSQEVVDNA